MRASDAPVTPLLSAPTAPHPCRPKQLHDLQVADLLPNPAPQPSPQSYVAPDARAAPDAGKEYVCKEYVFSVVS